MNTPIKPQNIPPKKQKKKVAISLDKKLFDDLNTVAKDSSTSFSHLCNFLLTKSLYIGFREDEEEEEVEGKKK